MARAEVWQELLPPETGARAARDNGRGATWIATLPDGRGIRLPVRVLPGGEDRAVASLIVTQAAFAVLDALLDALAERVVAADIVVGLPTLGLPVAEGLARRLGHARYVALGTSRKFWYETRLSEPVTSITSPGVGKRLWIDPRVLPWMAGQRVLLVDDVISTGASIGAALRLMRSVGVAPVGLGCCMAQGPAGADIRAEMAPGVPLAFAIRTPLLHRTNDAWVPLV